MCCHSKNALVNLENPEILSKDREPGAFATLAAFWALTGLKVLRAGF